MTGDLSPLQFSLVGKKCLCFLNNTFEKVSGGGGRKEGGVCVCVRVHVLEQGQLRHSPVNLPRMPDTRGC